MQKDEFKVIEMPTWLVFEDEPQIHQMVLTIYETLGVNGIAIATGEEALRWIDQVDSGRYNGELPQLALLDVHLPGRVTGEMVGQRIRKSPILQNMVLVLMTAYELSPQEEQDIIARSGSDTILYKPLPTLRELHDIFFGLLSGR